MISVFYRVTLNDMVLIWWFYVIWCFYGDFGMVILIWWFWYGDLDMVILISWFYVKLVERGGSSCCSVCNWREKIERKFFIQLCTIWFWYGDFDMVILCYMIFLQWFWHGDFDMVILKWWFYVKLVERGACVWKKKK